MPTPRLSLTLTGPREPDRCQACGRDGPELGRWQEHNERDQPARTVVVLCEPCSDQHIASHPRLYRELAAHEPWPGCMPLCLDCRHRDGVRCLHSFAKANDGAGVMLTMPQPSQVYLYYGGGKDRHKSGPRTIWRGPVSACAQKEVAQLPGQHQARSATSRDTP